MKTLLKSLTAGLLLATAGCTNPVSVEKEKTNKVLTGTVKEEVTNDRFIRYGVSFETKTEIRSFYVDATVDAIKLNALLKVGDVVEYREPKSDFNKILSYEDIISVNGKKVGGNKQ